MKMLMSLVEFAQQEVEANLLYFSVGRLPEMDDI
jgi:hypothetical protein